MSALGAARPPLFRPGGDPYTPLPDAVYQLPLFWLRSAVLVGRVLVKAERENRLDESLTTKRIVAEIKEATGLEVSESFVQKGLYALHKLADIIDRQRSHGRRIITFIRGLAARPKKTADPADPPNPPKTDFETETTDERPSSSLSPNPGDPDRPTAPQELIDRACRLVPKSTPGRVIDAVNVYGVEWVAKALDRVEERNRRARTTGDKPVRSWGFVLGILANWRKEGGPPPDDPVPAPPPTTRATTTEEVDPAEEARERRIREAWGLLTEAEREEIRSKVIADNPGIGRWPAMLEPVCLAELERRQAAELPRAP